MSNDKPAQLPHERWLPVPGYEGLYSVSNLGRIRSESRTVTRIDGQRRRFPGTILKPNKHPSGYLRVDLRKNNKPETRVVHRLVLEAFVGEAPPGTEACHWNDDPEDNRLENLRWGTRADNALDRVRNGGYKRARKTHCKRGHEFTAENTMPQSDNKGRRCKTCKNAWTRAKRRGMTLDEYFRNEQGNR